MAEREFDVVLIGAGPAGEVAAGRLADGGLTVAIVEQHLIGGECSFYACMPSKALLRPAQAVAEARRTPGAAEAVTGALDVRVALARRDEVVHDLDDSSQLPWLEQRDIALVRGHGEIDGERRVRVGDEVLVARRAVIVASGSTAALPPVPGLADALPWTNREATVAHDVPGRLLVLGGGVVGCELAQAFSSLGSTVTLVEPERRLLGREEPFAAEQVEAALRASGVDVRLGTTAEGVTRAGGEVAADLSGGDTLRADEILVAAGRRLNTSGLGPAERRRLGRRPARDRRAPARRRRGGLALRDRRRERPRAAHPRGQVPGPRRGGPHPREVRRRDRPRRRRSPRA